jgi:hypothetical protein
VAVLKSTAAYAGLAASDNTTATAPVAATLLKVVFFMSEPLL